jgi:AAA family ATP:ADP antiporter
MLGAGLLTAQFVAARAARDAIYLAHLDVTTLPQIVIATAAASIGLIALSSASFRRWSPATLVPVAFRVSGALFIAEWLLLPLAPTAVARLLYLHVSGLGPMLASAFWLIATEMFDPHTAKKHFGRIGGAGTLGGLAGAALAERVATLFDAPAILIPLAALNFVCAWQMRHLARATPAHLANAELSPELSATSAGSGLRALASAPYLRDLGALVLLGTTGAALLDYVFKVEAVSAFGRGDGLLRFFAVYYAGVSVATFAVQVFASQSVLEKWGLTVATTTPAFAAAVGGAGALIFPGLPAITLARAGESAMRGSLFRAGYEILYTPVAAAERRAAKSVIDVGCDRLGDAIGGALVRIAQMTSASPAQAIVALAVGCCALGLGAARRLRRGYVATLESSLINRALEIDLSDVQDVTTRTTMFRALGQPGSRVPATREDERSPAPGARDRIREWIHDPEVRKITDLRSRDPERVFRVLQDKEGISPALVPHIIPLLAWNDFAEEAVSALRAVAEERVGELTDALLDRNQPFAVRRRLARVFSVCVSQRAADGLIGALDDLRFEVRFQCGRSLAFILERNPNIRIDTAAVMAAVDREVSVGTPVWKSRQLLDKVDDVQPRSEVDDFLTTRGNQSLAHVFTLLSLVLPREPLRIAFRGLQTNDPKLRGTALEYLEHVLPVPLRERLWPFLDASRAPGALRPRDVVLSDLLRSNPSIMMQLEELRRLRDTVEKK